MNPTKQEFVIFEPIDFNKKVMMVLNIPFMDAVKFEIFLREKGYTKQPGGMLFSQYIDKNLLNPEYMSKLYQRHLHLNSISPISRYYEEQYNV